MSLFLLHCKCVIGSLPTGVGETTHAEASDRDSDTSDNQLGQVSEEPPVKKRRIEAPMSSRSPRNRQGSPSLKENLRGQESLLHERELFCIRSRQKVGHQTLPIAEGNPPNPPTTPTSFNYNFAANVLGKRYPLV